MTANNSRGTVGIVRPTQRTNGFEELLQMLPPGIELIPLCLDVRRGAVDEFKSAIPAYEEKMAEFAKMEVDVINPSGAPPFMVLGYQNEQDLIRKWEEGYAVVIGIKQDSDENRLMFWVRQRYYQLVDRLSGIETIQNFTGFGLYDRKVVEIMKQFDDPYPYFRGMISEIGMPHFEIPYHHRA